MAKLSVFELEEQIRQVEQKLFGEAPKNITSNLKKYLKLKEEYNALKSEL